MHLEDVQEKRERGVDDGVSGSLVFIVLPKFVLAHEDAQRKQAPMYARLLLHMQNGRDGVFQSLAGEWRCRRNA